VALTVVTAGKLHSLTALPTLYNVVSKRIVPPRRPNKVFVGHDNVVNVFVLSTCQTTHNM